MTRTPDLRRGKPGHYRRRYSGYEPDETPLRLGRRLRSTRFFARPHDNENPAYPKGFLARDGKNNGATAAQAKPMTARGCAPAKRRVPEVLQPLLSKLLSTAALLAAPFDQGRQPAGRGCERRSPRRFLQARQGLLVLVAVGGGRYWCLVSLPAPPLSRSLPEPPWRVSRPGPP